MFSDKHRAGNQNVYGYFYGTARAIGLPFMRFSENEALPDGSLQIVARGEKKDEAP